MEIKRQYRPEIEGLRAIAALLVAVYHIWMMRVSGGVDVFFVVSGFLITTSLLSGYARNGYIKFGKFILGLLRRLLPSALTVMIFITIGSFFILPDIRFTATIKEIAASLLYFENWQLAITGTDYLDQNNPQSPVQHFWAMSIQGQFYVIWFVIVSLAILISKKLNISLKKVFTAVLLILFTISLIYSIYITSMNQPWAYFDTGARVFEFAVGGLLMIYIFNLNIHRYVSFILGWIGLAVLLLTGILLDVQETFPGLIALIPISAAVLILLAGQNPSKFGVEKLLSTRPLKFLGGLSYGIYLWHWPILIFYYEIFDTSSVSLLHGIIIIVISILLSYITTNTVEKPIINYINKNNFSIRGFRPIIGLASILIICLGSWYYYTNSQASPLSINNEDYPGVMVNAESYDFENFEIKEPIPSLATILEDKTEAYECQVSPQSSAIEVCDYGKTKSYDYTMAVVGGSKSTHWISPMQDIAEEENMRLINITKAGCRFTTDTENYTEQCIEWNRNVIDEIVNEDVDLVITLADIAYSSLYDVPAGFIEQFNKLDEVNIDVLALRDTPYFKGSVPECIAQHGDDSTECKIVKADVYNTPSAWERLENKPDNVFYADYSDYFCGEEYCDPVVGNVIGYFDHDHMTETFSKTFKPLLQRDVAEALNL
ncbi:acyltransferase family protein [Jeotgalicoccus halotolerans]|uniref:Peptidoglycan/LPS O-acetylase OafA/YrhL n=1 Tax=Jeotgalicoccus halotolerans TaxID=157227 RepID=A0A3E0AQX7_9STAP|nr:acyltransferase family protein [Jeotgalicoccus halotolerans]REG20587.1 peptidoglycan/LPS O-acetylase OafA/YrhL [Jeotgalicoccus halotolerans]